MMIARTRSICIVNPFQHGGGAELQVNYLIDALRQTNRWQIYYLAHHVDPALAHGRYEVVKIGRGSGVPRFGYAVDAMSLYSALRRIGPDVIYQRVAGAYTGVCGFYARRNGVRFIWHVAHDADVSRGHIDSGRNFMRPVLEKRLSEFGLRRADEIVVQKQEQAALLARHYRRSATAVIPNFHARPLERIDKSGEFTVVWISNFKQWKQPEVFVRLAERLKEFTDVRFVMVGHLDAGCGERAWFESLTRAMDATPNLFYIGSKSQQDVNELLAQAHVFVNTSKAEGFPNTFIQAWMRGVPVVSLHVNPDDVLKRKKIGVHAGGEETLVNAVRHFILNRPLLAEHAENAIAYANQQHSLANVTRLVELIECGGIERQSGLTTAAVLRNEQSSV